MVAIVGRLDLVARACLSAWLALALLLSPLGACSMFGDWFGSKEDRVLDEPADKLYNEGLYLLNQKRDYKAAAKRFEEVDRQHPYSEWARKALLMSAFAYYEAANTTTRSAPPSATSRCIRAARTPPMRNT